MRALRQFSACAALALVAATPAAAATDYSNLFVFGDSLVDSGNAQAARRASGGADPAPASAGYFNGRFSNGFNFADYLSTAIGAGPATASAYGGRNFSVGGAQAREVVGDASPSFAEQLVSFKGSGQVLDSRSLVLVTFGGNDVRTELERVATTGAAPDFSATLQAFAAGLQSLYDEGARNFIVTGLPNIGQIPNVTNRNIPALSVAGEALSRLLNTGYNSRTGTDDFTGIDDVVATFSGRTGANAQFFDLFAYQQRIAANPAAFGLASDLDTRRACLQVAGAAPACNGFVYFDTIHPTTDLHRAIADGLEAQLGIAAVPEPASWVMMLAGFGLLAGAMRHGRRRIHVTYA